LQYKGSQTDNLLIIKLILPLALMKKNCILLFLSILTALSAKTQTQKHGFFILAEDNSGDIVHVYKRYSIDPKLTFSFQLLDTAFSSFDHNGYPLLLLQFKKTDSVYHMLSHTNRQLAMFYNDSLIINAKMVGFDSSYSVQLSGSFSLQEVKELE
jgi:preprotein translocase subunit SecD